MKKFAIYGVSAMCALFFAACDNYEEPNPAPQTNPQESLFKADDITVNGLLKPEVYDLTELGAAFESIQVAQITPSYVPEGYDFSAVVEISANEFETAFPVPASVEKDAESDAYNVSVTATDLENVYFENISKAPAECALKTRVLVQSVVGNQVAVIGGPTNFYGPFDLTIKPELRISYLYTPGGSNGWIQANSQPLYSFDAVFFDGYALLDGEFKFSSQLDWNGTNYGLGENEGELSTDASAGNLSVAASGLYYCTANIEELTYSTYLVETIGVIGDATPLGWDGSTALSTTDNLVWTGTVTFGAGEFKFRANDAWDVNLGGSYNNLTQGGPDLPSPGEGTYEVTLDLKNIPYSCTLVKK